MFKILDKKILNESVFEFKIEAPFIAKKVEPGQFVIIMADEKSERVPLTVSDFNREEGSITIVVQAIGFTTKKIATFNKGDYFSDVVGPLGVPTEFGKPRKAIVIGGGVGCAIAYPQTKALYNMGVETTVIAGFRNKDIVILEDKMRKVSHNYFVATDDGSYGEKGFVTDILRKLLSEASYDLVIAIGPLPMMKFVSLLTKEYGVKTIVSLNPIMIDGTGMCGGCRVTVGGKTKFACVDGPDFDGHLVDFDSLLKRNGLFRKEEEHACRLRGGNNG